MNLRLHWETKMSRLASRGELLVGMFFLFGAVATLAGRWSEVRDLPSLLAAAWVWPALLVLIGVLLVCDAFSVFGGGGGRR